MILSLIAFLPVWLNYFDGTHNDYYSISLNTSQYIWEVENIWMRKIKLRAEFWTDRFARYLVDKYHCSFLPKPLRKIKNFRRRTSTIRLNVRRIHCKSLERFCLGQMANVRRTRESDYFKNPLSNNIILRVWEPIDGSIIYLSTIWSRINDHRDDTVITQSSVRFIAKKCSSRFPMLSSGF